jgi:hypothetical protein
MRVQWTVEETDMRPSKQDMALAFRSLKRDRGFSVAVILTLALGVAAVTSVASVAYSVFLAPLPMGGASESGGRPAAVLVVRRETSTP